MRYEDAKQKLSELPSVADLYAASTCQRDTIGTCWPWPGFQAMKSQHRLTRGSRGIAGTRLMPRSKDHLLVIACPPTVTTQRSSALYETCP